MHRAVEGVANGVRGVGDTSRSLTAARTLNFVWDSHTCPVFHPCAAARQQWVAMMHSLPWAHAYQLGSVYNCTTWLWNGCGLA